MPSLNIYLHEFTSEIAQDLETSELSFTFTPSVQKRSIPGYKPSAVDLLSVVDQGLQQPRTGAMYLQAAYITPAMDLVVIANNRSFMIPSLTIENSHIVLYFG